MYNPLRPWLALAVALTTLAAPALAGATVPGSDGGIVFTSFNRGGMPDNDLYVRAPNGTLKNLTNSTYAETDPAVSPDGTRVAFTSNRDADHDSELFVMPIGGGPATQLTFNTTVDQQPTWSPDGQRIAFESARDGHSEIYAMNADGSGQTRLTTGVGNSVQPAWSPDGTTIAYVSQHPPFSTGLWLMNPDGTNQRFLTDTIILDAYPSWSPDSTHVAVSHSGDVFSIPLDGSAIQNLTAANGTSVAPSWSPDGTQLAFFNGRFGNNELVSVALQSGVQTRLTTDGAPAADDRYPDWVAAGPLQAVTVPSTGCPKAAKVKLGTRVQWNLTGSTPHVVHDDSGMGLFDTGSRTAPYTAWWIFTAAGVYHYHCNVDGSGLATATVAPSAKLKNGTITVTYASRPAPAGFVYDVQVKRPGSAAFVDLSGASSPSLRFTPDAGPGQYTFQARLRRIAGGAADYAAAKPVDVIS